MWDNSYSLSGFDWLSKEAVSYKLPSLLCFCLLPPAETQVSTGEGKFHFLILEISFDFWLKLVGWGK